LDSPSERITEGRHCLICRQLRADALQQKRERPGAFQGKPWSALANTGRRNCLATPPTKERPGNAPLLGFWPLQRLKESEVHTTRICLIRSVPLPGFSTLLGVFSSRNRPVLFHTGNAPGVLPPGLFPPADTEPFRVSLPSWRYLLDFSKGRIRCGTSSCSTPRKGRSRPPERPASQPPSGFCSPRESVRPAGKD
jgi:hypothetical protein